MVAFSYSFSFLFKECRKKKHRHFKVQGKKYKFSVPTFHFKKDAEMTFN